MNKTDIRKEILGIITRLQNLAERIGMTIEVAEAQPEVITVERGFIDLSYRDQIISILREAKRPMRGVEIDRIIRGRQPDRYISASTVPSTLCQDSKRATSLIKNTGRGLYEYNAANEPVLRSKNQGIEGHEVTIKSRPIGGHQANRPLIKCNQCPEFVEVSALGQHKTLKHGVSRSA